MKILVFIFVVLTLIFGSIAFMVEKDDQYFRSLPMDVQHRILENQKLLCHLPEKSLLVFDDGKVSEALYGDALCRVNVRDTPYSSGQEKNFRYYEGASRVKRVITPDHLEYQDFRRKFFLGQ